MRVLHDHDLHDRIDYARQQQIVEDIKAGRLDHETGDALIRACWPPCHCCGDTSACTIGADFYCLACFQIVWPQRQLAQRARQLREQAAAAALRPWVTR